MPSLDRAHGNPYDREHRKRRAALLPAALGTPCPARISPRCTRIMTNPRLMHLDHSVPVVLGGRHGDRIICAPCNTSAGASLGNRLRNGTPARPRWHSRRW